MSVNSDNPENRLYTTLLDWSDDAPTAHDLFYSVPDLFSAILEDTTGNGRDFLVSKQGVACSAQDVGSAVALLERWKCGQSGHRYPFPGIRQLFYAAYEAGRVIESLPEPKSELQGPMLWLLEPEWSICIDQAEHKLYLASRISQQQLDDVVAAITSQPRSAASGGVPVKVSGITSGDPAGYRQAVERVKAYITAGDIFQANIARFWHASLPERAVHDLYSTLRQVNPAPFSCFVKVGSDTDALYIISASPERLFSLSSDGVVETRPIAGTRRRGEGDDDECLKTELLLSDKEQAEHIMLVDLERNDLGRICKPGSVEVNERMTVERYSTVQHIVSNVRGRLAEGMDVVDVFRAMFPGGTITGCPKIHCMEIIYELEEQARGPYTGGVGYVGWDGSADMNILIRTFWHHQGELHWAAGAGIVADSDPAAELEETGHKAEGLLRAIRA
ncbi:MAG: chorismate-binding protein [Mariprofundaceae bacterium]|nr:chorismate-binding protein [Mariprofundaceae bacterium]